MNVPPSLRAIAAEIEEYNKNDGKPSPYVSENYPNGYSYQKFSDGNGGDGSTWRKVYASRLSLWRKL